MAEVTLEHLDKVYANGVHAVRHLSLVVADGELVVLVGPSGSGKTTILRLIAGLEEKTGGTIGIGGRVADHLPPRQRDVALVFQKHALYPHLSVRENLAFGLRMRHRLGPVAGFLYRWFPARYAALSRQRGELTERVADAARMLELEEVLERLPAQLSGGQQQRTALGRALVRRPAVFLMDEPLSNLDAPLRAEMRRQLHLLHRRLRATMIYVTHDQTEAMALGQRIVVLDRGVVQQADRPAVVYDQPRNRFVAGFIGWPPMNFLDGTLLLHKDTLCFAGEDWFLPLPDRKASCWEAYRTRPVTLGIRPEHVSLQPVEPGQAGLGMEVVLVESLGSDLVVTLKRGDCQLSGKMKADTMISGQAVKVYLDMRQTHLFDRTSGLALPSKGPEG